jgi:hypothetical protein
MRLYVSYVRSTQASMDTSRNMYVGMCGYGYDHRAAALMMELRL